MKSQKKHEKKRPNSKIRVLVLGGPTRQYLDPVRFISNISTGSLAFQLCTDLMKKKIETSAIIGPTCLPFESLGLKKTLSVETNQQMLEATMSLMNRTVPDVVVFSAAILDFAPIHTLNHKQTSKNLWRLTLKPTEKIIEKIHSHYPHVEKIAFKLETSEIDTSMKTKLKKHYIDKYSLLGLCVNRLDEIQGRRHKALVFNSRMEETTKHSKSAISNWIVSQIEKACYKES